MFENCKDQSAFKIHLRDFLVQIKEFGDAADLYPTSARRSSTAGRPSCRSGRRPSEG